ncbi:MAG TPA: YdeI/OmpD-associated family protein [Bacteroidota bacterium]|nr:YdeI/OmpD-associated family protein [Bacteroidota bacterium]
MGKKDPRIDAYIERSADFAKPILRHLRKIVHKGCPAVEETIKWGRPNFMYKGILCGMAAFKHHCVFGLWKGDLVVGKANPKSIEAMGNFGRITNVGDLPSDSILISYINMGVKIQDAGIKPPSKSKRPKKPLRIPSYLARALGKSRNARTTFENFSNSNKRDYVEWLTEAKTEETRLKRLKTAIEWMVEGKERNWKYMRKLRS